MKRTDLKVGEEYAYRESVYREVHRVKIVALDAPRGGVGYNKDKRDAIEIEYVGEQPSRQWPTHHQPKDGERWVTHDTQIGRHFIAPWAEHVAAEAEAEKERVARKEALDRRCANANAIRRAIGLDEEHYSYANVVIEPGEFAAVARKLGISLPHLPEATSHAN